MIADVLVMKAAAVRGNRDFPFQAAVILVGEAASGTKIVAAMRSDFEAGASQFGGSGS